MKGRRLGESDAELIERARSGELAAYDLIVCRYQDLAFRIALAIVGSAQDAEDVAQEGFLRAYRALHRFRPGAPLRPWLVTIMANTARSHRTAAARRAAFALSVDVPDAGREHSPEAKVLDAEAGRELLAAVNGLREEDRLVITARFFLELSEAETAAVLGCALGTVKSRQSRALARLRDARRSSTPDDADRTAHG